MSLFKALVLTLGAIDPQTPPVEIGPFNSMGQCTEAARVILTPQAREVTSADGVVAGTVTLEVPKNTMVGGTYNYDVRRSIHCYEVHHP